MADSPAASGLWLPRDVRDGKEGLSKAGFRVEPSSLNFPTEFPYEFDSLGSNLDLNSPVESVLSSTESMDSIDEDDFFVRLTQRLAWSSLYEPKNSAIPCLNPGIVERKGVKASSPQSTLSGIDYWFRPKSPSQLKSPPMKFLGTEHDAWDLIHAAAGEAARLKFSGETTPYHANDPFNRGLMGGRSSIPVRSTNNGDYGLFSDPSCTRNLEFAAQVQQVKQDLVLRALYASYWARQAQVNWSVQQHHHQHQKQDIRNRGRNFGTAISCLPQSASLPLQSQNRSQHNGSAIHSVNLGGSGVKRVASSGTGVFLPRRYDNPSECRQKPGSPTSRYPGETRSHIQAPFNGCLAPCFDDILARRNPPLLPLQRSMRPEAAINHELHLPHEWTY